MNAHVGVILVWKRSYFTGSFIITMAALLKHLAFFDVRQVIALWYETYQLVTMAFLYISFY